MIIHIFDIPLRLVSVSVIDSSSACFSVSWGENEGDIGFKNEVCGV
jgi:hypothetical protein